MGLPKPLACLFLFLLFQTDALAVEVSGPATIIDADTLDVAGTRIRLHGIDAPETRQRCVSADKKIVRPSNDAIARLETLTRKGAHCQGHEYDDYGRLIAVCQTGDGIQINRTMVSEGFAWAFVKYSSDYVEDEAKARQASLGVWSMRCETPWAFRAHRWEASKQRAPNGCPIKGNISAKGAKIYHPPWGAHYAATRINEAKGERWFCSEGEAMKAGWRPSID